VSEPILRAATAEDDEGIRATIRDTFPDNPKQQAEITAWQYWSNPFGRTCVWVWEDDGKIVATYANFPMPAVFGGRPGLAGNGVDAAVDPAYQGRKLFAPLASALYADSRRHGIEATMCFINNPFAIKGTTRAGWLSVGTLGVWVLPVDDAWLSGRLHVPFSGAVARRASTWRLRGGASAEVSSTVPRGVTDLWSDAGGVTTGVMRDQAWWDWRYGEHPAHPYTFFSVTSSSGLEAAGVALVRSAFGATFVYLLELVARSASSAQMVMRAARSFCISSGAVGVGVMALPGSRLAFLAGASGMRRVPQRFDPKPTSFGAVPNEPSLANLQSLSWSVSWGDLDHL
jgi:predicted N-acetyltransferase YhbS